MAFHIQRTSRCLESSAVLSISYWFFYCYTPTPHSTKLKGGTPVSHSPSVRLWTESCPLCNNHNTSRIHLIFADLINQLQKVCPVLSFVKNSNIWIFGNFFKCSPFTLSCVHVMWMLKVDPSTCGLDDVFPPDDLSSGPYTQSIIRFFLVYQADVSIFYTSNLYWWGKGWPVDGLPFPDTGCPVPDVSIYYMSNINELPDGILFHWFCKCTPPWMFLPLDIPSEYRPEHVTFGLLCVIFKFPSRIFCRRVPGFATDCPCGVWCRGLTTCLLYVGPPLEF